MVSSNHDHSRIKYQPLVEAAGVTTKARCALSLHWVTGGKGVRWPQARWACRWHAPPYKQPSSPTQTAIWTRETALHPSQVPHISCWLDLHSVYSTVCNFEKTWKAMRSYREHRRRNKPSAFTWLAKKFYKRAPSTLPGKAITWGLCVNALCLMRTLRQCFVLKEVWGEPWWSAFLTSSQAILLVGVARL